MKFTRRRIVTRAPTATGIDANGDPTTTATVTRTARGDLILGNGTSEWPILQRDEATFEDVTSVALTAAYTDESTWEILLNGNSQIWCTVHTVALGAGGVTGLNVLFEFQDPDHPNLWIPSKEGINREANAATHTWGVAGIGDWLLASREEHRQFAKARVRFKAMAGTSDAATKILVSWHHNGGRSAGEILGNDPV